VRPDVPRETVWLRARRDRPLVAAEGEVTSPVTPSADDALTITFDCGALADEAHRRVVVDAVLAAFRMRYGYDPAILQVSARGPRRKDET
jgi:hypothetical protein